MAINIKIKNCHSLLGFLVFAFLSSLLIPVKANSLVDQVCSPLNYESHLRIISKLQSSMLKNNSSIRSKQAIVKADNSSFLSKKTFYYPDFKFSFQPISNYKSYGYSDDNLVEPSDFDYKFNQYMNYASQIEMNILNLPAYTAMKSSWYQLKSSQDSLANTIDDTTLELLRLYITAQSLQDAIKAEEKVVDQYKQYSDTQLELLNAGFSSILDYNNQYGNYLTVNSKLNETKARLTDSIDRIYEISSVRMQSKDFVSLPSPRCLQSIGSFEDLALKVPNYYQPIIENENISKSFESLASSAIYQYAPKITIGYAFSYYSQYGNISGVNNQIYNQYDTYPYLKFSLAFNLGGQELYESEKNIQNSSYYLSLSNVALKRALREISVNITKFDTNKSNYDNYSEIIQDTLNALMLTENAVYTGLINYSLFLSSQSLLFMGIEAKSDSLIDAYTSYMTIKRLTSGFPPDQNYFNIHN